MTGPDQYGGLTPSRPARSRLGRGAPDRPSPAAVEAAEIAEGQTAAVLGALARMQLRLDLLAREQSDLLGKVLLRLDELEQALAAAAEASTQQETAPPAAARPTPVDLPTGPITTSFPVSVEPGD